MFWRKKITKTANYTIIKKFVSAERGGGPGASPPPAYSDYTAPRTRTRLGDKALSVAGPVVWNSLPAAVREADSLHSFRRKLKTHMFALCFNDWL